MQRRRKAERGGIYICMSLRLKAFEPPAYLDAVRWLDRQTLEMVVTQAVRAIIWEFWRGGIPVLKGQLLPGCCIRFPVAIPDDQQDTHH
jgi:hypothetical protein